MKILNTYTKKQLENNEKAFKEIQKVLEKYPKDTPVFILRGLDLYLKESIDFNHNDLYTDFSFNLLNIGGEDNIFQRILRKLLGEE